MIPTQSGLFLIKLRLTICIFSYIMLLAHFMVFLLFHLQCIGEWNGFLQKGAINLPDERFLLTCIKVILLLLVEIHHRQWWIQNENTSVLSFCSIMQCILSLRLFKGQNFYSGRALGEKSDKTGCDNRRLYLCVFAPWNYLWSFQHDKTNPKKLLYNKKYFQTLVLLHNIIHIWCGRDNTSTQ